MRNKQLAGERGHSQGTAFIFIPYWAFGFLKATDGATSRKKKLIQPSVANHQPFASAVPSRLRATTVAEHDDDDTSDGGSTVASHISSEAAERHREEEAEILAVQTLWDFKGKIAFNKTDHRNHEKMSPYIKS